MDEQTLSAVACDAQAAIDAGISIAAPAELDPAKAYDRVIPAGATRETLDLERLLPAPRRTRGTVTAQTVDDLARYVQRHDDTARTTIWVDALGHGVTGVLNDHQPSGAAETPGWGDHRVALKLELTPEWQRWTTKDGKLFDQEAFAEHIELGLPEIVTPDGAELLEIAQSIEGSKSADFKVGHRLTDGNVQIEYVETTTAKAGQKGELEIPAKITLAIAPFLGEQPCPMTARFRYRIQGGHLSLGYLLERPDLVIRQSIDDITDRLGKTFGVERVFVGKPRSA